ncbi:beta-lactamase/transpeptidase-like protein [Phaeosphaeriaceae sp. PMI808]|nr:beta-lactamase/transpeptidase-like protein [Phaeosphaeriaceae sp. PMI808]
MRSIPLVIASLQTPLVLAATYCPFLGPVFPPPTSLSTNSEFTSSIQKLQSSIQEALSSGNSTHGPISSNDTYSVQIFSTKNDEPLLDMHHRGTEILGNRTVDGDSVYRIASTTKLITVYLLLLQVGDSIFEHRVTKYLPELAGKGQWDDITVGALAGYLAGIAADAYTFPGPGPADIFPGAFPILSPNETSPCVYGQSGCTREVFLSHLASRRQVFLPNTTPGYSNAGFATLGLILETATGLSYNDSMKKLLGDPLALKSTTSAAPKDSSIGVIVGDKETSGWSLLLDGPGIGMGGLYSSANDLSIIGRSILSSKLLPGATTRAWFKPTSHTSSLIGATGRPWEIFRATLGPAEHNRVTDLYTKGGNVGGYGANLVLLPDYDVGFVVLTGSRRGRVPTGISGIIVDHLLPALEEAARTQAHAAYAGTYRASGNLNSSLILTSQPGVPGLTIAVWISNGTDIIHSVMPSPQSFQLYPTNVKSADGRKHSWRSSYLAAEDVGPFSACPSWFALDRPTYGVYGLDEFEFGVDGGGKAVTVEPKALKVVLERRV